MAEKTDSPSRLYQREKQRLALGHLFWGPLVLLSMVYFNFTDAWSQAAQSLSSSWPISFALFFLFFSIVYSLLDFPFSFYSGYVIEKKYNLSTQTVPAWLADYGKRALLGFLISLFLLLAFYGLLDFAPQTGWLWAWSGFALFTYGVGKLFPILVVPIFYRYGPVDNPQLKERIARLGERYGLSIDRIQSINLSRTTRKANAAFMGMGRTKKVVLSDTLLSQFADDEIEAVLAHELGHCCHKDIWRMFVLNLVITFGSFYAAWKLLPEAAAWFGYDGASDRAALPLLLLIFSCLSLVIQPLTHAFSRSRETQADRFALIAMNSKDAFIRCMRKLARVNLADPDPHPVYEWFFYDHPAIKKRIAYAESFQFGSNQTAKTLALIMLTVLVFGSALPGRAEESAVEKDFNHRQKMEWKRFYLDGDSQMEMPQTSLAVDFFNQAVEAYQGQDYELAREAIVESLKLNARNSFAYELLGDMALEEHALEDAQANYKKAYLIQPSEKLKEKIEKAGRESDMDEGFQDFESEHFRIRTKQAPEGNIDELKSLLEGLYAKLAEDFGYALRDPVTVTLYERSEFEDLTRMPHWVGGVYDGKIRLPAYRSGILDQSLGAVALHEMTHAFVGRMSRKKAPAWIQEGLAVYMEAQKSPRDWMVLRLALKTNSLLSLDELMSEQKVTQQGDVLYASLFYEQAYSYTDYLLKRYGMFKIKKLLVSFAEGYDYDQALRDVYGLEPAQLEKKWKKSLVKKFS